jgi:hypothetical protein
MKNFRWLMAGTLMLAAAAAASAQPAPTFNTERLDRDIRELSSDAYQGRAPATAGEQMTVEYLSKQLQAAGVQPGGDLVDGRRQWTQRVPLLRSEFVGSPQVTIQTATGPIRLTQGEQVAVMPPVNGQKQLSLNDAPLVFAGYGVTAPERGWDDFKGQDVRGKILVVLVNDPDFEGGEGDFGGKAMTYYGRWSYKNEEAARRGAAGRTPSRPPISTSSGRTPLRFTPVSKAGSSATWRSRFFALPGSTSSRQGRRRDARTFARST